MLVKEGVVSFDPVNTKRQDMSIDTQTQRVSLYGLMGGRTPERVRKRNRKKAKEKQRDKKQERETKKR